MTLTPTRPSSFDPAPRPLLRRRRHRVPDLRAPFRNTAASPWAVTTHGPDGSPVGFTATSVVSVSLDPAIVSFNIARTSSSLDAVRRTRRVALHLLAENQSEVARRLAGPREQRFPADGSWRRAADGLPEVLGAAARVSGEVTSLLEAGDSYLVLVQATEATPGHPAVPRPLVHHAGDYHQIQTPTHTEEA